MCAILSNALNLRDDLGGRNTASYFCHLPSIATLNLILSSSLLSRFLFFFLWQIKFTRAMRACISQRRSFIRLPRRETPRRHIAETFPHYRRSTPAPHQLSGSAQKKKKSLKLIHRRQLSLSETGSRDNRV